MSDSVKKLPAYQSSLAGTLLSAREAVMAPIRPVLRDANVTEQQWRVLRVLNEQDSMDAATITQMAILLAPSVTRILRELEERGLIERKPDVMDGRRAIVSITRQGRNLLAATAKHTLAILETYGNAFGKERLANLIAELGAFREAIEPFRPD
jgi:homoprotocatechuate degradation regulator HpaR